MKFQSYIISDSLLKFIKSSFFILYITLTYIIVSHNLKIDLMMIQTKSTSTSRSLLFWLYLLITACIIAQTTCDPTPLVLDKPTHISIPSDSQYNMTLTLNTTTAANQSLFLTAQSPFNDPFQQPIITITSDANYQLICDQQQSDYMDICQIQSKEIKPNRVFNVNIYCQFKCEIDVQAYIANMYVIETGDSVSVVNPDTKPRVLTLQIDVPSGTNFTQIMILLTPEQAQQSLQATVLVANYGKDLKTPTATQYKQKAQAASGHRLALYISNQDIKQSQSIICLLILPSNSKFSVSSTLVKDNEYQIYIGYPIQDFITDNTGRIYTLDLKQYADSTGKFQDNIYIKFITYSGKPDITVSLDRQFTQARQLLSWSNYYSQVYQITAQMRKDKGGDSNKLYIKVDGYWTSNYYLQVKVNQKPFVDLQPHMNQYLQIQPNQVKNLIFEDYNTDDDIPDNGKVDYKITIFKVSNDVNYYLRDCGNFKQGKTLNCIISAPDTLNSAQSKQSFQALKYSVQTFYGTAYLKFTYNIKQKCQKEPLSSNKTKFSYTCKFHIAITTNPLAAPQKSQIQLQVSKNAVTKWLVQGGSSRGSVQKGSINYYAFQLFSVDNATQLQFYATVLQGDVSLLMSRQTQYPSFDDFYQDGNDLIFGAWNSLTVSGKDLTPGYYYIGVLGQTTADYTIAVAIQHSSSNNNNPTQIQLIKSQSQMITMPVGKTITKFTFTPSKQKQNSVIKVTQMQGVISYKVIDKSANNTTKCSSEILKIQSQNQCYFQSELQHEYSVIVTGASDQVQIFTIVYSVQNSCNFYSWNYPIDITLSPTQSTCISYILRQSQDIHVYLSLSPLQLMNSNLSMTAVFGEKYLLLENGDFDRVIKKEQLESLCKQGLKQNYCVVNIKILNRQTDKSIRPVQFLVAVQNYVGENVLFDGQAVKRTSSIISTDVANHYFYYVFSDKMQSDVQIFLTSKSQSKYQLAARVVSNFKFSQDLNESLYPRFDEYAETKAQLSQIFQVNSSQYSSYTVLTISSQIFSTLQQKKALKSGDAYIVLISVFGIPDNTTNTTNTTKTIKNNYRYSIEVNQDSYQLQIGQSDVGVLYKGQYSQYDLYLVKDTPSKVQVRSLSQQNCIKAFLVSNLRVDAKRQQISNIDQFSPSMVFPTTNIPSPSQRFINSQTQQYTRIYNQNLTSNILAPLSNNALTFSGVGGTRKIVIFSSADYCSYQITFSKHASSVIVAEGNVPYQVNVFNGGVKYFLCKADQMGGIGKKFTVVQMVKAGSAYLYARLVKVGENVDDLVGEDLNKYPYSGQLNQNLQVNSNQCVSLGSGSACYFLIAIQGSLDAQLQLTITPSDEPILIKSQSPLRDRLQAQQFQTYQYYHEINSNKANQVPSFAASFMILYGQIDVQIYSPSGDKIGEQKNISDFEQVQAVDTNAKKRKTSQDNYFDDSTRYLIKVQARAQSSYYISIKPINSTARIYQGIPSTFPISSTNSVIFQFFNIKSTGQLTLLIQDLTPFMDQQNTSAYLAPLSSIPNQLRFQVVHQNSNNLNMKFSGSEYSYSLNVKAIKGWYNVTIYTILKTDIVVLFTKDHVNSMLPDIGVLGSQQGVYAMYSKGQSVLIQIWSCNSGINLEVKASNNYTAFTQGDTNTGLITLQHANYGNHYVVTAQKLQGQFFVSVKPQKQLQNGFIMIYHYYNISQKQLQPYKYYTLPDPTITYTQNQNGGLDLTLTAVQVKQGINAEQFGKANQPLKIVYKIYVSNNRTKLYLTNNCGLDNVYFYKVYKQLSDTTKPTFTLDKLTLEQLASNEDYIQIGAQAIVMFPKQSISHVYQAYFQYDMTQPIPAPAKQKQLSQNANMQRVAAFIVTGLVLGAGILFVIAKCVLRKFKKPTVFVQEQPIPADSAQNQVGSQDVMGENRKEQI